MEWSYIGKMSEIHAQWFSNMFGVCLGNNKEGFLLFMSFATIATLFLFYCLFTDYSFMLHNYSLYFNNHMYDHISLCIIYFDMKYRMQCDIVHHSKHVKIISMIIFFQLLPLIDIHTWKNEVIVIGSKEIVFIFKDIFIQGTLYLSFWFP